MCSLREPVPAPTPGHLLPSLLALLVLAIGSAAPHSAAAAGADRYTPLPWGSDSPAGRCVVCHSLERGGPFRVAPNLWGVIGAPKAWARDWYTYSPALLEKGGVWTADELDEYLADANQYLPGTRKSIHVKDPGERERIIEFLNKLRD